MDEQKPNFIKNDLVAKDKSYYTETVTLRVAVAPYDVKGEWRMMVQRYGHVPSEVLCKDWHLVGERKPEKDEFKEVKKALIKITDKKYRGALVTAIVLFVLLIIGLMFTANYNSLVSASNGVDNRWSKVETQYQRRLDLIDNVVQSVQGAQGQEQKVFGDIAKARSQYNSASSPDAKANAASQIETNVALIPRLQEAYPDLKSNTQVTTLITELQSTENTIAGVRNDYNDAVTNYNTGISRFPKNLFANLFGYHRRQLFKSVEGAAQAPKVRFNSEQ